MKYSGDYTISIKKTTYAEDEEKKLKDIHYVTAREQVYYGVKNLITNNYELITPQEFTDCITDITCVVYRANIGDILTFTIKDHKLIVKII